MDEIKHWSYENQLRPTLWILNLLWDETKEGQIKMEGYVCKRMTLLEDDSIH